MSRVCDYEESRYRYDFWEGQGRDYEDLAERIALRALLPPQGDRLIEIGAGYGRLAALYAGYEHVVLLDYARTQLEEAQQFLDDPERYTLVVADIYHLPFIEHLFDTISMVRVMHHLSEVPAALAELHRILMPDGVAVIEHANKCNWKAVARWLLRRQAWSPFDQQPVEFVELNYDFHPAWIRQQLAAADLILDRTRTVSHFRIDPLKRVLPAAWLAAADGAVQPTGNWWQLSPSVFVRARARKAAAIPQTGFFKCPACGSTQLVPEEEALVCEGCGRRWSTAGGIYDFKTPLN